MRVMVLVKAGDTEDALGTTEDMKAMGRFNEDLAKAGKIVVAGEGLLPSKFGKRVVFEGKRRSVVDGPFAETRELVAGFWIWEVKDMAEALDWVKRCPNPMPGRSEIEIRPIYGAEEFAELMARMAARDAAQAAKS